MRVLTLKEISAMEPGEVVPAFRCQIKEVREPKSGNNQYGDWTIQSLTVLDSSGVSQVKLFDCPVYDAQWVGVWILIESSQNDKGKLAGVEVSEYNKRKEIHVKGKAGAKIEQVTDAAPEPAPAQPAKPAPVKTAPVKPAATAPQQTQAQAPAPVQPTAGTQDYRKAIGAARKRLGQAANALIMAYDAAFYVGEQVMKAHPELSKAYFTPEILERIAVSLSIQLDRGLLTGGLPAGPLESWLKKQAAAPEPPPDQEPNWGDDPLPE